MALKILSIDGGGIRGIIPGQILVALENKIRKRPGHEDGKIEDTLEALADFLTDD
jgi:patatin-like phospholipase/acyl hydrolase